MRRTRIERYFGLQASLRKCWLHPGGREASLRLLALLGASSHPDDVIELGCGSGQTAALLLESFACRYTGIDNSPEMLELARTALIRWGDRVRLESCDLEQQRLPLEPNSVDAVIAESVIAIVDPHSVFAECRRVLRAHGVVLWIDRIWSEVVPAETRKALNELSRKVVGFPAAPEHLTSTQAWKNLVEQHGFELDRMEKVYAGSSTRAAWPARLRASLGILRHPSGVRILFDEHQMGKQYAEAWSRMESWLFVARLK